MTAPLEPTLPDLPDSLGMIVGKRSHPEGTSEFWGYYTEGRPEPTEKQYVYTADQMREYARAALAAPPNQEWPPKPLIYTKAEAEWIASQVAESAAQDAQAVEPRDLAHELEGVIADVEQGGGFDAVCLETIKRVRDSLYRAETAQAAPVVEPAGLPYGIIDPDYARVFTIARTLAWSEGYAIAMQGSFTRDLDLVAIPWTDAACGPEQLVRRIEDAAGLERTGHPPGEKPHGRRAWTLLFPGFSDPRFVDLSVMPRAAPTLQPAAQTPAEPVVCLKCGHENWIQAGKAMAQVKGGTSEQAE